LFKLESSLSDLLSRTAKADLEAHSAREQLEKLSKTAAGDLKDSLEKRNKELSAILTAEENPSGHEDEPGLDEVAEQALGLYGQVGQVDAAPTGAQQNAGTHVAGEAKEVLERWERFKNSALPALNQKLDGARLPRIDLERRPETMPEGGDEE
jgi:hypothetical protein